MRLWGNADPNDFDIAGVSRYNAGPSGYLWVVSSAGRAAAQQFADDATDFQTWGNITATGNFGFINPDNKFLSKLKWWAEGQGRFGDNSSKFSQSLIRPGLGYQLTDTTSVWVGYAWAPTSTPYVRVPFDEQRLW